MKINTTKLCVLVLVLTFFSFLAAHRPATAKVVDDDPVTDQRWVISEIYLGKDDYSGAYLELYNNDEHTALGWKDFVISLPFDADLPPIYDLKTYKSHAYKTFPLDESVTGWLIKKYIQVMYGDSVFHEIQDALDEQDNYSYQRCQTTLDDGSRVISNKFYYGKKTPGKPIDCDDKTVTLSDPADLPEAGLCIRLKLNEIYSYTDPEDQFIELINTGNDNINLSNCYLSTSKDDDAIHLQLDDYTLEPGAIYSIAPSDTDIGDLTKTSGIVYIIDSDDETVVNYKRYSNIKKGASVAIDDNGKWQQTYHPTPGEDNAINEYPDCPSGQYRDEQTHKCRQETTEEDSPSDNAETATDTSSDGLKPCKEGYERNPATNRCRKIQTNDSDSTLVPCREGYTRNPATNRCVKQTNTNTLVPCREGYTRNPATNRCVKTTTTAKALAPCKDGYERNPDTNRCIKKKATDSVNGSQNEKDDNAKYPVDSATKQQETDSTTSLVIVVAIIIAASIGIAIWQYRREIMRWWHKITKSDTDKIRLKDQPPTNDEATAWMDRLTSNSVNDTSTPDSLLHNHNDR